MAGASWHNAIRETGKGLKLQHTGRCVGIYYLLGWYLFTALVLAAVDFPLELPVGDLSGYVKGPSDRRAVKEGRARD
jgi:hypothetical protein